MKIVYENSNMDEKTKTTRTGELINLTCSQWPNYADQRAWSNRKAYGGAFGSRHNHGPNHGSQLRSRCSFYGGRNTGEKHSKHRRDQLQQLYSHKFQV